MFESTPCLSRDRGVRPVRSRRSRVVSALIGSSVVAVVAAAGASGCSDPAVVVPRAAIASFVGPGTLAPASGCGQAPGSWVEIGDNSKPASDGDGQNGGSVRVSCSVTPAGDGFAVVASATLSGSGDLSGSITIDGHFTATGEQTGIAATFTKGNTGTFRQKDCTVTYTTPLQTVAAGRVWGFITCPTADLTGQNRICEAKGEFKFENCAQ